MRERRGEERKEEGKRLSEQRRRVCVCLELNSEKFGGSMKVQFSFLPTPDAHLFSRALSFSTSFILCLSNLTLSLSLCLALFISVCLSHLMSLYPSVSLCFSCAFDLWHALSFFCNKEERLGKNTKGKYFECVKER